MKFKSLGIAFAMAVGLFFYGYCLSTAGHDHSAHADGNKRQAAAEEAHDHGNDHHEDKGGNSMLEYLTPLHPKLVHFPIALFITALVLDLISLVFRKNEFHQSAVSLYVGAALLTPLVVRTGIWEAERLHLNHPLLTKHSLMAQRTMWLSLMSLPVLWFVRKEWTKYFRVLFIAALIAVAGFVTYSSHLGGQMVYEYGVGVQE